MEASEIIPATMAGEGVKNPFLCNSKNETCFYLYRCNVCSHPQAAMDRIGTKFEQLWQK